MSGAAFHRGSSKQEVQTPPDFIAAVKRLLRIDAFAIDLAASPENAQAPCYLTKAQDSLSQPWDEYVVGDEWAWLNPEFNDIAPWAEKCATSRVKVAMLVPASVGSNWFRDFVHGHCVVCLLNGRLTFVGETQPYPKDCLLCLYGKPPCYVVWSWKTWLNAHAAAER